MISPKSLIVGVVGAGCIAAAGLGAYLAVRTGNSAPYAAPAAASSAGPTLPGGTTAEAEPAAGSSTSAPAASAPAPQTSLRARAARPAARVAAAPPTPEAAAIPPAPPSSPASAAERPLSATEAASPSASDADAVAQPVVVAPAAAPAAPAFDEVTVRSDTVIGIQLTSTVSSESAKIEDRVTGKVVRDVTVDGRVMIPAGALVDGAVTSVQRGGKFHEQAKLGVRFTSVQLGDLRVPIQTETIIRLGEAPTGKAASKIGASAAIGAVIGGIFGGKKGAAIGTTAGAAGGTAAVMAGDAKEAVLAAGTPLTLRLTAPATFEIERAAR
ncbi:MAG: hypothetical protein IT184_18285 [Acidobacteria bacterium]|nr:hypothetical protein [Acidobacteriota bacterium]